MQASDHVFYLFLPVWQSNDIDG